LNTGPKSSTNTLSDSKLINKSTPRLKGKGVISQLNNDLQSIVSGKSSKKLRSDIMNMPLSFNIEETTGLNIYSFGLLVERNGEVFGSSEESLLDLFLYHINDIIDLRDNKIVSNYNTSIRIKDEYLIKLRPKYSTANIVLGIELYLTNKLKYNILKKLQTIYKEKMDVSMKRESQLNDVISLFPSKKINLIQVLTNTEEIDNMSIDEIKSEMCCKTCTSCMVI